MKKPDLILSADWHLRGDCPRARIDDFFLAMNNKINEIFSLANKFQIPILISGDICHRWNWTCRLLEWFVNKVQKCKIVLFAIPGQHDLRNHSLNLWRESAIGVLHAANAITLLGPHDLHSDWGFDDFWLHAFPYGEKLHSIPIKKDGKRHIAMTHQLVMESITKEWEKEKGSTGLGLLKQFPDYSLILTGDNHKSFVIQHEGRLLVNPGSIMRSSADQIDHKPRVYLWWAENNQVEPVYLPVEQDVIDRTHIESQEVKDRRMEAYISRMSEEVEIGLSFEENLKSYFAIKRIRKPVQDKAWRAMPDVK